MPRKRDGFVPSGDVAEAVALPGDRALTHHAAALPVQRSFTRLLHPARPGAIQSITKASPTQGQLRQWKRRLGRACKLAIASVVGKIGSARRLTGAGVRPQRFRSAGQKRIGCHRRVRREPRRKL